MFYLRYSILVVHRSSFGFLLSLRLRKHLTDEDTRSRHEPQQAVPLKSGRRIVICAQDGRKGTARASFAPHSNTTHLSAEVDPPIIPGKSRRGDFLWPLAEPHFCLHHPVVILHVAENGAITLKAKNIIVRVFVWRWGCCY